MSQRKHDISGNATYLIVCPDCNSTKRQATTHTLLKLSNTQLLISIQTLQALQNVAPSQ